MNVLCRGWIKLRASTSHICLAVVAWTLLALYILLPGSIGNQVFMLTAISYIFIYPLDYRTDLVYITAIQLSTLILITFYVLSLIRKRYNASLCAVFGLAVLSLPLFLSQDVLIVCAPVPILACAIFQLRPDPKEHDSWAVPIVGLPVAIFGAHLPTFILMIMM